MVKKRIYLPLCLLLTGCDSAKEHLGFISTPPDEFTVVSHEPLEIPKDLTVLQAPERGKHRPQEKLQSDIAYEILFHRPIPEASSPSDLEKILLSEAGADDVIENIRGLIEDDAQESRSGNLIETTLSRFHRKGDHLKPDEELERLGLKKNEESDDTPQP